MTPAENEQRLKERYRVIEDPQERLAAVMALGKKQPALSEAERTEANRVQGCTSRVWLLGEMVEGKCRFRLDADSALVKGLAVFLGEVYQGGTPAQVAAHASSLLEDLHLSQHLSPTRQHGLQQVGRAIRELGARWG